MRLMILLVLTSLAGCTATKSHNEEIIAETQRCEKAGMSAEALRDLDGAIVRVQCAPKEGK